MRSVGSTDTYFQTQLTSETCEDLKIDIFISVDLIKYVLSVLIRSNELKTNIGKSFKNRVILAL